jgi:putative membrane protein
MSDPFVISASDLPPASAASPAAAPPPPDEDLPQGAAMQRVTALAARRRSRLGRLFWSAASALLSLVVSIAAYDYITGLLARFPALGMAALVLTAILGLVVLVQLGREMLAFRRLARIDGFRAEAAAAHLTADRTAAAALADRLARFYAHRPELAWGTARLREREGDVMDADALIHLTERSLMEPLDTAARREIEAAARTVAGATALIPLALVDVLAALSMNRRMIRRIAETYGAHAGFFGSWRLLRAVATHLLATGAVAIGDDTIHSLVGGSALARISRRFGEGVVNGALTARVGIAAMEVCRPLPFEALPRPRVTNLLSRALTGLFPKRVE